MRKPILKFLLAHLLWLTLAPIAVAKAQIAVVVDSKSSITNMTKAQVRSYFLGEAQFLPSGERLHPVDQPRESDIAKDFYNAVASMSVKDVAVRWAKEIFAGRGVAPPQIEGGDTKIKEAIRSKANSIGYIYADSVDKNVKVLLLLSPKNS